MDDIGSALFDAVIGIRYPGQISFFCKWIKRLPSVQVATGDNQTLPAGVGTNVH